MARPTRSRRICKEPLCSVFYPVGNATELDVVLSLDEFETIRLIDFDRLTHKECASSMDISRTTVTELYESARFKLSDALVNGKRLLIQGGNYRFCDGNNDCCKWKNAVKEDIEHMLVAVTYDNSTGEIFQHFGHTETFKIYQIENNEIKSSEVLGTNGSGHGALAGLLREGGVDVLICGGIGGGAQQALAEAGIKLYGGVAGKADAAVEALIAGKLEYNPNVRCSHHDTEHGHGEHHCGDHGCGGEHRCH